MLAGEEQWVIQLFKNCMNTLSGHQKVPPDGPVQLFLPFTLKPPFCASPLDSPVCPHSVILLPQSPAEICLISAPASFDQVNSSLNGLISTERQGWGKGDWEKKEQKRDRFAIMEQRRWRRWGKALDGEKGLGGASFREQEKRWQSGNTGVELKGEDRLMKHEADAGRQHPHQVLSNFCLWKQGSYDPKIILLFSFHMN